LPATPCSLSNALLTTASTAAFPGFRENRFLHWICLGTAAALLISAYRPERVFDWWLENALVLSCLAVLIFSYRYLPLSDLSYLLILVYLSLHEWGAHYKYSDVPLGEWMKPWLHTQRNHFDRVSHFCFGLMLSYPMREVFMRVARVTGRWRYYLPVEATLALSAIYEMMEAGMATVLSPQRGEEFVGMQGDIWDSQKDMFDAGIGSILAMLVIWAIRRRARSAPASPAPGATTGSVRNRVTRRVY
jgi:putative membrane protein